MHRTFKQWLVHFKKNQPESPNFSVVSDFADRLSVKKFSCPVIVISGTNGKGSIAKTLESIYTQAGYKTALYTSPHLLRFNERIRIANQNMDDLACIHAFEIVEKVRAQTPLSFFALITLSALALFQEAACDVIILEVGLGGRLDPVNVADLDVAVLASIGFDHRPQLGNTLTEIAFEKIGIARAGKPFVCGEKNLPAPCVEALLKKTAQLYQINQDFHCEKDGQVWDYVGRDHSYQALPLPHLKLQNVATALAVIEQLRSALPIQKKDIEAGIRDTKWPGRFEYCASLVPVVLDVAHNAQAASWLAVQYQRLSPIKNTVGIIGLLRDKSIEEIVTPLLPIVTTWFVCNTQREYAERGTTGKEICQFLATHGKHHTKMFVQVSDAMDTLVELHCQDSAIRGLIFGSVCVVAAAKNWQLENN